MEITRLFLIIGPPASGKTTLSRKLETDLSLPVISSDDIKERICISLNIKDDEHWSDKLNIACYDLLFYFTQKSLTQGSSLILESDFRYSDSERIAAIAQNVEVTQVLLEVDPALLIERFKKRWHSGERHPIQADHLWFDELAKGPTTGIRFLDLPGKKIRVDATSEESINYPSLLAKLIVNTNIDKSE